MMGQLVSCGHELTAQPAEADVIVVNTCSFIDPAKQESVDTILEMAEYKKTGKRSDWWWQDAWSERYRDDIRKNMPEVDAVLGTNELDQITALCEGLEPNQHPIEPYLYHDLTARVFATPKHFAYIKIAEGCDHPCTFCVIPQYPRAFRSRRFESVINEATRMFAMGVREINLIGQDTTCYGEDLGLKDGLGATVARLAGIPTEQPKWVRFLMLTRIASRKNCWTRWPNTSACEVHRHASAARERLRSETDEGGANGEIFLKLLERVEAHDSRCGDSHSIL